MSELDDWKQLLDPVIASFITAHAGDDPAALALRGAPDPSWPWRLILDQIAARAKTVRKLPHFLAQPGVIIPPATVVEQASSLATARYKASLLNGDLLLDLTAGSGADSLAIAGRFKCVIAVERDATTAAILAHNAPLLTQTPYEVHGTSVEGILDALPAADAILIDPQRRDGGQRGIARLEEGSPNILALKDYLLALAPMVLLKTSPMLDIDAAVTSLKSVAAVHIVEWDGDAKEVLYVLSRETPDAIPITAVTLNDAGGVLHRFTATRAEEAAAIAPLAEPGAYLLEPGPALQKAGTIRAYAARRDFALLHPSTRLYTTDRKPAGFPGRIFTVQGIYPGDGKGLKLAQANITVRNFPMSAEDLRRKLKIRDGGDDTLVACTLLDGRRALIHGVRA